MQVLPKDPKKIYIDTKYLIAMIVFIGVGSLLTANHIKAAKELRDAGKTCKELFRTQPEAQAVYDSDPVKWSRLDGGNDDDKLDGIPHGKGELACENLPLKLWNQ